MLVWHPMDSHPCHSLSIGPPIPGIQHFQMFTLKIQDQSQMTMMVHNYRWSRQFHRTSNGINQSSGFRGMGFAKSGPSASWFDKFLAHGQARMGLMGKITMTLHNYRPIQFHRTLNGDMDYTSLAAAHSPAHQAAHPLGPWRYYPSSPEGWGVKT